MVNDEEVLSTANGYFEDQDSSYYENGKLRTLYNPIFFPHLHSVSKATPTLNELFEKLALMTTTYQPSP